MARQERAIRTRRAILDAAAQMFNELGYEASTIGMLIERVPLTRGGVYFHFTSKEELARAVLDEAVTSEGLVPQALKLQEWVDLALLLAYRVPREPVLSASIQLSVDPKARSLFGTRWPDWIAVSTDLLTEAKKRGELRLHVDPAQIARLVVGAWTGVQLVTETLPDRDLSQEVSALFALVLPGLVPTEVLAKLDISHYRAEHLLAAARSSGGEPAPVPTS
ncbi:MULTISPECIES: ScbR family autoregulator-binding transcription factor [Streptomyces]|uniref:ScbR family autoregulator-binding transcription factor n=1 Tax=Streptomyces caniscabiei TaxID=2746961 RepID=A0ABU4N488_9ACTN|nr:MULTISPECIES: ScbR family autoregulator-binding transcription factor [Streptomyces]MBE4734265.1 TetR/AcrR family transcriptional regulator [Streptomyces caniscabiei]MBE4755136.1 TetR/AcrR family transcriptional regulator [Streptomyces caniscabiei]MBE4771115.1 TetR/AcrR family transcriptional regulator [Streptomyces caniscabiei]MBE4783579.1 TetR/AcrR family transcriptional regulator [Streptomyces caniscabiei]MBE4792883.1 TetR/AcrR family transcriptional regulator [Streptomyces caniscabiei]